jgi:hypothetical protein
MRETFRFTDLSSLVTSTLNVLALADTALPFP